MLEAILIVQSIGLLLIIVQLFAIRSLRRRLDELDARVATQGERVNVGAAVRPVEDRRLQRARDLIRGYRGRSREGEVAAHEPSRPSPAAAAGAHGERRDD